MNTLGSEHVGFEGFFFLSLFQGDDPPYLAVGTEVSAKYKGAFCEAKVRKVVRSVKCKVRIKMIYTLSPIH
jgi:hypothetical protein